MELDFRNPGRCYRRGFCFLAEASPGRTFSHSRLSTRTFRLQLTNSRHVHSHHAERPFASRHPKERPPFNRFPRPAQELRDQGESTEREASPALGKLSHRYSVCA